MSLNGLLRGELWLTFDILLGLAVGDVILRLGLADWLMLRALPWLRRYGIGPVIGTALTLSLGSSRAGAALLASALEEGRIERRTALWGVLTLPLPGYLRRWPTTFALAVSMAGVAGGIFALFLFARSVARFFLVLFILRRSGACEAQLDEDGRQEENRAGSPSPRRRVSLWKSFGKRIWKTLPLAWLLFAATYALAPWADRALQEWFARPGGLGAFLPLAGWTVAAGSIAHISAALALAGGSLAAGELTTAQAVFALILGSGLGIVTRTLRQNSGYYFGLFPADLARQMLFWNLGTMLPLVLLSLLLAALPLAF